MKIKTLICVMGMLLPLFSLKAQQIKPLKIGDTMPDLVLHNVINYKDSFIRLSDFKDKLVILDFMNTYCGTCIHTVMQMENLLQRKLPFQPVVLLSEPRANLEGLFRRQPVARRWNVTWVVSDSLLEKYFPHKSISHIIWLSAGRVVAITGGDSISAQNIMMAYHDVDRLQSWPVKNDFRPDGTGQVFKLMHRDEKGSFVSLLTNKWLENPLQLPGTKYLSGSALNLYRRTYELDPTTPLPVVSWTKDPQATDQGSGLYFYYYAFKKDGIAFSTGEQLRRDLDAFFHIRREEKWLPFTWKKIQPISTPGMQLDSNYFWKQGDHSLVYYSRGISEIVTALNFYLQENKYCTSFTDSTGYFLTDNALSDQKTLRDYLRLQGLEVKDSIAPRLHIFLHSNKTDIISEKVL